MVALGIHSHWLKGIDYMGMEYQDEVILFEWIFILQLQIYKISNSSSLYCYNDPFLGVIGSVALVKFDIKVGTASACTLFSADYKTK